MDENLEKLVIFYLKSCATPHCLKLLSALERKQWDVLVSIKADPGRYLRAEDYLIDAQASSFFTKLAGLHHAGLQPVKAAKAAWWEAEHRNALTNIRLGRLSPGLIAQEDLPVLEFLERVKRRLSRWLGPLPDELYSSFGPGVTLCCRGSVATVADKMTVSPTTTTAAWPYAQQFLDESAWFRSLHERKVLTYVEGSASGHTPVRAAKWFNVPKNAKTDRSIEIGPNINVALQLCLGTTMKSRFRSQGWDLLNAAPKHVEKAKQASIDGLHATIDLKQASDSVSRKLVEFLLPSDWFSVLNDLRTKSIEIDGRTVYLEKFSGMGNGFTFELESVIFMSIAQEVCNTLGLPYTVGEDVFVFGDDIIVPTGASKLLIKVLNWCGFETNVEKTFVDGPFRESCGGDFFGGQAVRPYYIKELPNEPQDWIAIANGLWAMAADQSRSDWYRRVLLGCRLRALRAIPTAIRRCRGPVELGDIVIHDEISKWTIKTRHGIRKIWTYRPVARLVGLRDGGSVVEWDNFHESVKLATILLGQGVAGPKWDRRDRVYRLVDLGIIPRKPRLSFKFGWVPFS